MVSESQYLIDGDAGAFMQGQRQVQERARVAVDSHRDQHQMTQATTESGGHTPDMDMHSDTDSEGLSDHDMDMVDDLERRDMLLTEEEEEDWLRENGSVYALMAERENRQQRSDMARGATNGSRQRHSRSSERRLRHICAADMARKRGDRINALFEVMSPDDLTEDELSEWKRLRVAGNSG